MTTYFVDSFVADDTGAGTSWATAKKTLASGIALATASGDVVKISHTHQETIAANTNLTAAANVAVVSVDKTAADVPTEMDGTSAYLGSATYSISILGAFKVFYFGVAFRPTSFTPAYTDGAHCEFEKCKIWLQAGASNRLNCGAAGAGNGYVKFKSCDIQFTTAGQQIAYNCATPEFIGCTFNAGTAPTVLIADADRAAASDVLFEGCDLSIVTGTLVSGTQLQKTTYRFVNCKIGSGVTPLGTASPANRSSADVWLFNCASGDESFRLAHYNALGSTVIDTTIYANDNPTYDGTNKCSWKISTTANSSFYTPYVSPWLDKYHAGTSAITPYLEVLREGSTTAYQTDEVWAEFSYQGTTGVPLASFASDRMALLGSPANQDSSSKASTDWTGENASAWFGKLDSGSAITPAEIGHLRARVCLGEPSITLYVDPQIRGV